MGIGPADCRKIKRRPNLLQRVMVRKLLAILSFQCLLCTAFAANYLTFTAEEDGSQFGIKNHRSNNPDLEYSLDGGSTWTQLTEGETVTLVHKGDKALLRGENPNGFCIIEEEVLKYTEFQMQGLIKASGSVMSLIDGVGESVTIPSTQCFCNLFSGCSDLTQAPELPATTLETYCYQYMFSGCRKLTEAPKLPATTLADGCYYSMFSGTGIVSTPQLPASTLCDRCYEGMFYNCYDLVSVTELPAVNLGKYCYAQMFFGCKKLVKVPTLPATSLPRHCYYGMFMRCSGLVNAPAIRATSMDYWSCYEMFEDCESLVYAPSMSATVLGESCCCLMFANCVNLRKAPSLPATTLEDGCYRQMFSGCKNLEYAPSLPATIMEYECYEYMFRNCTNLASAPSLPATTLAANCYSGMFMNCTSLVEAPALPATSFVDKSNIFSSYGAYEEMFSGCTSLTKAPTLPATSLYYSCYSKMFEKCEKLSEVKVYLPSWREEDDDEDSWTVDWLADVAPTGTFICPKELPIEYGPSRIPEGWNVVYIGEDEAVEDIANVNTRVWTDGLNLYVRYAGIVEVYDLNGKQICKEQGDADSPMCLSMPAHGVYVVKMGGKSSKVEL